MKPSGVPAALPTIEEIEQYQTGTLSAQRSHEIEVQALENPLVADALEGYASIPAYAEIPDFKTQPTVGGGTPWWHIGGWIIGITAGVILAVVFIPSDKNQDPTEIASVHSENDGLLEDSRITQLSPSPQSNNESQESLIATQNNGSGAATPQDLSDSKPPYSQPDPGHEISNPERTDNSEMGIKIIERNSKLPVLLDVEKNDPALKILKVPGGADITHFRNYKLVDYTKLRKKTWPAFSIDSLHLSPEIENDLTGGDPLRTEISLSIPYITYLERCIEAYSNGYFETAAERFEIILERYPKDLNAQFYGAMSYYQMASYEKSLELFDRSLDNVFKIFREESEFYKALALKKMGRIEEAKQLFQKISKEGGYYAKRATQE